MLSQAGRAISIRTYRSRRQFIYFTYLTPTIRDVSIPPVRSVRPAGEQPRLTSLRILWCHIIFGWG